jgi:hypothetical protein
MSRFLVVRYDVTGLTPDEVDELTLEAVVQAEASDGHRAVSVTAETVEGEDEAIRAVLDGLSGMTSDAFATGADRPLRDRLARALGYADADAYYAEQAR